MGDISELVVVVQNLTMFERDVMYAFSSSRFSYSLVCLFDPHRIISFRVAVRCTPNTILQTSGLIGKVSASVRDERVCVLAFELVCVALLYAQCVLTRKYSVRA